MAYTFTIVDVAGRVLESDWIGHLDRSYQLHDGGTCPVHDTVAWCAGCRRFVPAERLKSPDEIDADLDRRRRDYHEFLGNAVREDHIQPWLVEARRQQFADAVRLHARQRRWRTRRKSPPRCLRCGSDEVRPWPDDSDWIRHPLTGVRVSAQCPIHMSMATHELYSEEGVRLDERF